MKLLNNLKLGRRLTLGYGVVLALAVLVGVFSVQGLARVNQNMEEMASNWMVSLAALDEYRSELSVIRSAEGAHLSAALEAHQRAEDEKVVKAKAGLTKAWATYAPHIDPGQEEALAAQLVEAQKTYLAAVDRFLVASRQGADNIEQARELYVNDSGKAYAVLLSALNKTVEFQSIGSNKAHENAKEQYTTTRNWVVTLLALAVAVSAAVAYVTTRSITQPIDRAVQFAKLVAAGDLTTSIVVEGKDETAQLLMSLQQMNASLSNIVEQVRNGTDSIATGSAQIATGNADLSQRTEEQASNLQQTAASMEQLTATVQQNTETARQAKQLAVTATMSADHGGDIVGKVTATMQDISQASRKVADIIGVIDSIAFQTNILALNAAVEAARAGEQGRGFAVVAGEVRALAQRSAEAAREIKTLIGQSVEKVEAGARLTADASASMTDIVASVKRVTDLIGEISAASEEQSSGIGQVGSAVAQLDQVTQQNAALVEESAAAADSLKQQAAQMAEVVSVFKVAGQSGTTGKMPAPPKTVPTRLSPAAATQRSNTLPVPRQPVQRPVPPTAGDSDWTSF